MAKRKTAPTDSAPSTKKTKTTKAAANTKVTTRSASKTAANLEMVKAVTSIVTNDVPAAATVESNTSSTTNTATPINDEEEFEIDFDAVEDDDTNTTLVASDDDKTAKVETVSFIDKSEKAFELVVDETASNEAVAAPKSDTASEAVASTTDIVKTPEEATITNNEDVNKVDQDKSELPSATEQVIDARSNDEWKTEYARQALINGLQTQLTYAPAMLSMAGASAVGDTVDVCLTVNDLNVEVSFKIIGLESMQKDETVPDNATSETTMESAIIKTTEKPRSLSVNTEKAQNALQIPLSHSPNPPSTDARTHIPCKFGESCTKGDGCPFDHTVVMKKKLCTWVNTTKGCTKGEHCHFSHDYEGKMCTKSTSRMTCENGATCAFMHNDDGIKTSKKGAKPSKTSMAPPLAYYPDDKIGSLASSSSASIASLLSPGLMHNLANQKQAQNGTSRSKNSYNTPINAPTGPKNLGKGGGQKRHAESEGNGYDEPRPRKYNNHNNQYRNQQQAGYTSSGPQNGQAGRKFAHPRGGHGHRGKNNSRGGRQLNPYRIS